MRYVSNRKILIPFRRAVTFENSGNLCVPVKAEIISRPAVASNRIIATSPRRKE